uniref:Doublecortin domain containing 1 n=1 Tax=Bos mutus grunniens TaxID=30521 RepID=A0A8B9XEK8_BOSMU
MTEDHKVVLCQSPLSPLTKVTDISQQSNPEDTFNGDTIQSTYKYISNGLPREFMSSQAKAVIKTTEEYLQPQFGPNRLLHSAAVSEGSGLQDCSTHQTASDHSHDEISDPDSYKSNSKNNSCFISVSKRNRPVSAPVGQLRVAEFSSKFKWDQNWHRLSQRHKLQPRLIRVTAYKNGSRTVFAKVTVPTITLLLEECTEKLNLNTAARRVFLADGTEALEPEDIPREADVYVSTGESFLDPFKKIKVPLLEKCLQNSITPLRGPVWVSKGEGFSPSGAKMYIQGVLLALYQRLKSAKKYSKQLKLAVNEQKGKVTEKVILSMTVKEHRQAQAEVNRLIDELQTAIKSNRGHLSKLGPQLQAEQEQFSSYVYQHIKSLPANTLIPGGLQLKVGVIL